jgi:hypothetical protein
MKNKAMHYDDAYKKGKMKKKPKGKSDSYKSTMKKPKKTSIGKKK